MNRRILFDIALFGLIVTLASVTDVSRIEGARAMILAGLYLVVGALAYFRRISPGARNLLDIATAAIALGIAWFVSFAAWSHSGEIGIYLLLGFSAMVAREVSHGEGGMLATG